MKGKVRHTYLIGILLWAACSLAHDFALLRGVAEHVALKMLEH